MPAAKKPKSKSSEDQYTKPELRDHIKDEVMADNKGGKPGQWSARKAQLVSNEYEKQGGGYKHPRTESQEHLHEWTEEHWKTADGKPAIRDGKTARYLPEKAWEQLSDEEKRATDTKKAKGSKAGKQFVPNTSKASEAMRKAQKPESKASGAGKKPAAKQSKGSADAAAKKRLARKITSASAS